MGQETTSLVVVEPGVHDLVLFDLDGVLTPTADVHRVAWGRLFADHDFTDDDYLRYIDGRSRYDGVRTFLASRGLSLSEGNPVDHPGDTTVCALGNRKDALFREMLERDGVAPYADALDLLDRLDRAGVGAAVVSSSRNAGPVLEAAGLRQRFEIVVDGVVIESEGIAGKPDPAPFALAAERAGVPRDRALVIEDAESGVAAGATGGFAIVIGVDRVGAREALLAAGANVVVDELTQVAVGGGA